MNNKHYSIEIKVPVISKRDNINIKDTINLIKRKEEEQKLYPEDELEITLPSQPDINDIREPVRTRTGRISKAPDRYGS